MIDSFFDPFWNLEQIRAWACTRDPEVVRFAADGSAGRQSQSSLSITVRSAHSAVKAKQAGRDVNLELWRSSGWPMPENTYVAPMAVERLARDLGVPVFWVVNDASLEVQFPKCEEADTLLEACSRAQEPEREVLLTLFRGASPEDEPSWLESPKLALLSAGLRQRLGEYVNRKEIQGPWRLLRHAPFPVEDYLLQLFRTERLSVYANLPDNPVARMLTKADWGGLQISAGGELQRLTVWRIGHHATSGGGDFENARVERDAVLKEFPAEAPMVGRLPTLATDDAARAVIRMALDQSGGFLSQNEGAEIVRSKIPAFPKKRAMQLVKELTGNDKPGPKGPRNKRAANRAG